MTGRVRGWGRGAAGHRAATNNYQAGTKKGVKKPGRGHPGKYEAGGAGHQGEYKDGGAGRQDTRAPTVCYQAGTTWANRPQRNEEPTDIYQAGTKTQVKKPGKGRGRR